MLSQMQVISFQGFGINRRRTHRVRMVKKEIESIVSGIKKNK